MSVTTQYDLIARNQRRSVVVIAFFVIFVSLLGFLALHGGLINSQELLFISLGSLLWSLGAYFFSSRVILCFSQAKKATKSEFYNYYTVTENLCLGANMPMPKLYVIDDPALNAFATGLSPQSGVICVTTGLLAKLDRHELEAVVAHELSHIRHFDIRLASLIAVIGGAVLMLVEIVYRSNYYGRKKSNNRDNNPILALIFFVLAIFAPLILNLLQLALSRQREFLADAGSVQMTRNPQALIKALKKISSDYTPLQRASAAFSEMYISDPFKKKDFLARISHLFSTHPSITERIKALESIS